MVSWIYPNVVIPTLCVKAGWLRDSKPSKQRGIEKAVVSLNCELMFNCSHILSFLVSFLSVCTLWVLLKPHEGNISQTPHLICGHGCQIWSKTFYLPREGLVGYHPLDGMGEDILGASHGYYRRWEYACVCVM